MNAPRSPIAQLGVRAASPLAIITGAYLLFAGHNQPGGGFGAGLVLGAVIALRTVTGLQKPVHANTLISVGVLIICAVAAAPLVVGNELLDQQIVSTELPLLGKIKLGSALPFDVGVTAVVVGLILALLDGLGAANLAKPTQPAYRHATATPDTDPKV